ncbi:MerR family transcriptional regulator [Nocardioides turkmenicus]|uniref:MerR family transcriptional regulator n=1 Tax=Nocardioides turkmenicus TaxID=2711220 RepID=UPI0030B9BD57
MVEGLEAAIEAVERSQEAGSDVDQVLLQLRRTRDLELPPREVPGSSLSDLDLVKEATPPPGDVGYRGPTACNAAGISYRQLDYWARTGLVEPSINVVKGSGTQRLYSFEDILLLALTKKLLDAGVSLQQIRIAILHLRKHPCPRWTDITLMSDGQSVYEANRDDELLDLMASGRAMFGISLASLAKELRLVLGELPAEPVQ